MYTLKQELASMIAAAEGGAEIVVTRHGKSVARLTAHAVLHLVRGELFGRADLRPALRGKTSGRYLKLLLEDRQSGRG
jgi:antitoxin (DNA-binding transcriptional repressor) of toxin-antitoxin stability system